MRGNAGRDTCWRLLEVRDALVEERDDPVLIQVIEKLGKKANGRCAQIKIEDVPKGALWRIDEYDGNESVMTQDAYEWKVTS